MAEEMMELGFPLDVVEAMECDGRWPDLSRLSKRRPEVIPLCCWLLGLETPVREIGKRLKLSPCTVQKIGEEHAAAVVTEKAGVAKLRKLAIRLGMERVVEQAAEGKLTVFDLKLLWDMDQVESGGVTERKELRVTGEEAEALAFFQSLEKQAAGGMVFEAEVLPQSAAPVAAAATRLQQMVIEADQGPESPPINVTNPL